jgi:hypothetical protein
LTGTESPFWQHLHSVKNTPSPAPALQRFSTFLTPHGVRHPRPKGSEGQLLLPSSQPARRRVSASQRGRTWRKQILYHTTPYPLYAPSGFLSFCQIANHADKPLLNGCKRPAAVRPPRRLALRRLTQPRTTVSPPSLSPAERSQCEAYVTRILYDAVLSKLSTSNFSKN